MEASWGGFCGLGGELERLGGIWKPLVDVFGGIGGVLKVILAVLKAVSYTHLTLPTKRIV